MTVILEDYRPSPDLDAQIAEVGYAAVQGWADQRPVTGPVMRSLLRPTSMTATTLALHRDDDGELLAVAALRWPAMLNAPGLLWGPMVHPSARGRGLGRQLLVELDGVIAARPGAKFITAEIPESRASGWALFEELGWRAESKSSLMARQLPAGLPVPSSVPVRPARQGEYLGAALAGLYAANCPDASPSVSRDTFARWSSDSRYKPDGLLLAEAPEGLVGVVLVYPCEHPTDDEPAEARIDDLLTCVKLPPDKLEEVRATLVAAALRRADESGATIARIVVDNPALEPVLRAAGFEPVERLRHYASPY